MGGRRDRPIFVVGFPRSGTTLVHALLGAHPRIASPPETHFVFRIARLADFYGDFEDDDNLRRALTDFVDPSVLGLDGLGVDVDRVADRLLAGPRGHGALLDGVLSDFAARRGKARWCEKSPGQSASELWQLVDRAQVVHVVRDPRDAIASAHAQPFIVESLGQLAVLWRARTRDDLAAGERAGPDRYLRIRHEDLLADPPATLERLMAFLDEPVDPTVLDPDVRRANSASVVTGPWQLGALDAIRPPGPVGAGRGLGPGQRALVDACVADLLGPLGYASPGLVQRAAGPLARYCVRARAARQRRRMAPDGLQTPEDRYELVQRHLREVRRRIETP